MNHTYKAYGQDESNERCVCRYEGCCYVPIKECPIHGDFAKQLEKGYWEEEFEGKSLIYPEDSFTIENPKTTFGRIFRKYISEEQIQVTIKARKGKIVIERVE